MYFRCDVELSINKFVERNVGRFTNGFHARRYESLNKPLPPPVTVPSLSGEKLILPQTLTVYRVLSHVCTQPQKQFPLPVTLDTGTVQGSLTKTGTVGIPMSSRLNWMGPLRPRDQVTPKSQSLISGRLTKDPEQDTPTEEPNICRA